MSSSPPTTLGQYQIIREIARSNDIVYEAYDPLMNRRVAVKELALPQGLTGPQKEERIGRFKREAQAAGTLNHANIMTVYSFAEDAGRHFMAMEYLDGHTLRNEIDTKGFLPKERAVEVATAVLEGLAHAHSKGVIHRDIKPDNIQILSNNGIKITDFGIARLTFQPNLTMDGQVFGTPSYMSPEQIVGKEIDQRSDVFSVGIVLYEMLGGQKPFPGDSVVAISYAIMNKEPAMLNQVDNRLWEIVRKALEKSPHMRYQSADDFARALKEYIFQPPVMDAVPNPYPTAYGQPAIPAPPPVYSYNPYTNPAPVPAPQMGQVPPPQPGFPPPQANPYYTQAPIYYPPPPRQPLLKPEQSQFLKRLFVTILLIGTLFLVVVVGVSELSKAVQRWQAEKADMETRTRMVNPASTEPVYKRIQSLEEIQKRMQSESQRSRLDQDLAALYELQGKEQLHKGDLVGAENSFRIAVEKDPLNAALNSNLADLFGRQVNAVSDTAKRAELALEAGRWWARAAKYSTEAARRRQYAAAAVQYATFFASGVIENGTGSRAEARRLLLEAREATETNSPEQQQVDGFLSRL